MKKCRHISLRLTIFSRSSIILFLKKSFCTCSPMIKPPGTKPHFGTAVSISLSCIFVNAISSLCNRAPHSATGISKVYTCIFNFATARANPTRRSIADKSTELLTPPTGHTNDHHALHKSLNGTPYKMQSINSTYSARLLLSAYEAITYLSDK